MTATGGSGTDAAIEADEAAELDPIDRAALERAFNAYRVNLKMRDHIDSMAAKWYAAARFAAYSVQIDSLHLRPWESPPCVVDEDSPEPGDEVAANFLRRMLALGISRFDPDPLAAIEAQARSARPAGRRRTRRKVTEQPTLVGAPRSVPG
jgi:hypothetical protein